MMNFCEALAWRGIAVDTALMHAIQSDKNTNDVLPSILENKRIAPLMHQPTPEKPIRQQEPLPEAHEVAAGIWKLTSCSTSLRES